MEYNFILFFGIISAILCETNPKYFFLGNFLFWLRVMVVDQNSIHSQKMTHKIGFIPIEKIQMSKRNLILFQFWLNCFSFLICFLIRYSLCKIKSTCFSEMPMVSAIWLIKFGSSLTILCSCLMIYGVVAAFISPPHLQRWYYHVWTLKSIDVELHIERADSFNTSTIFV